MFVARNRFAVLDKTQQILIKDLKNETTKRIQAPYNSCDNIFFSGTGTLLLKCDDKIVLFDLQTRKILGELSTPGVKYVVWSNDLKFVALQSKHTIVLATKKLELLATIHESIRIKSCAWDDSGVLIYTTLNHMKYCLPSG